MQNLHVPDGMGQKVHHGKSSYIPWPSPKQGGVSIWLEVFLFWLVSFRGFRYFSPSFSLWLQQTQNLFASFNAFFSPALFLLCVGTWILFYYKRIKHSTTLKAVFLFSMLFLLYFFYAPLQWLLTYQAQDFVFYKWSRSPDSTGNRSFAWTEEPTVTLNSAW